MLDPSVLPVGVDLRALVRLVFFHPVGHGLEDISHLVGVAVRVPPGLVEFFQYRRQQFQQGFLDAATLSALEMMRAS